jgi:hypothetical protein
MKPNNTSESIEIQKWADGQNIHLVWESGEGDGRMIGWEREDGSRVIETNADPIKQGEEDFVAAWDARGRLYDIFNRGVKHTVFASNDDEAERLGAAWVAAGDWSEVEQEEFEGFLIVDPDGVEATSRVVVGGPREPACEDGNEHDWQSPYEVVGGVASNPGVFSDSNGQFRYREVCCHCGHYRTTITASLPGRAPEVPQRVSYQHPDCVSLNWVDRENGSK